MQRCVENRPAPRPQATAGSRAGRLARAALAACALAAAAPALAQQAPEQTPPPRPQEEVVRVETMREGAWTLTCQEFAQPSGRTVCNGLLQMTREGTNDIIFVWRIGRDEEDRVVGLLQSLTGVLIEPGITLVAARAERQVPFTACEPGFCTGIFPIDAAFASESAGAETLEATVTSSNGQRVQFRVPVNGLDAVIAAVRG